MDTDQIDAFLPLRPSHFHILLSLVTGPVHGYGVRRLVEERTGGRIVLAAGTLYETLQRLEARGLIHEVESPAEAEDRATPTWRCCEATRTGRDVVTPEVGRLEADVAAGLVVVLACGCVLSGILFQVEATDPLAYVAVTAKVAVTAIVALAAAYGPARGAGVVDPVRSLRQE